MSDLLSNEVLDAVVVKINDLLLDFLRIEFLHSSDNLTTCKLLNQESGALCSILHYERISSTLVTERSVSLESMSLRALPDRYRVEVCALKEHVDCRLSHTRLLTTKYTRKAHRLLCISDHKVSCAQCALHAVESNELLALFCSAHYNLATCNLRCIERMKRLADLVENEVCDVYDVVDRPEADSQKLLLEPLRRCGNLDSLDCSSGISWSSVSSKNLYRDCPLSVIVCPRRNIRKIKLAWHTVMLEICIKVSCHTDMGSCIHAVCSKTDLDKSVSCKTKVILRWSSHNCLRIKHHDTIMRLSYTEFILRADHTE